MNKPILGFEHIYIDLGSNRTLLLLHGTGGDEKDLLPIGQALDDKANILSPRGKVLEDGMPRFFKRLSLGVFDREDLKAKSQELGDFLKECSKVYNFPLADVIAIGYSNGANIALHLLASRPQVLSQAILFRPMSGGLPETTTALSSTRLLVLSGLLDVMINSSDAQDVVKNLKVAGAQVEFYELPAGHGLTGQDIKHAKDWLA